MAYENGLMYLKRYEGEISRLSDLTMNQRMNMPIEKVDGFYFHPDSRDRVLAQRYADRAKTPWTPMEKPLEQCKVTLVSTAGIFMKDDVSFDYE